jgi:DNA ligase-1
MTNFKPMLACKVKPEKIVYPVIVQEKLDGIRASVVNGRLVSRTLKLIPNAEIQATLGRPEFEGLDGEIIVGPVTADDAYRRTCSFTMAPDKIGEPWTYYVFDKWDECGGYADRWKAADDVLLATLPLEAPVALVGYFVADDSEALLTHEALLVSDGHEGAILRSPDGEYKFGRATATKGELGKLKRFCDFEARIVDVYERMHNGNEGFTNELGRTARSSAQSGLIGTDSLGGFILVAENGPWAGQRFRCGTGFNEDDRNILWVARDSLYGRLVKIKAFEAGAKDKPRFPVWLGWRNDFDFEA